MKRIMIDLETRSDVDITKAGAYRYADSPYFEILLFACSIDDAPVVVYDLANGDALPDEIISALTNDSIEKHAYNAQFERVCLSAYLRRYYPEKFCSYSIDEDTVGDYLNPASWRCTMVASAYLGLPLHLAGVGAVLKLEQQKMVEGKALIKYFCVPYDTTDGVPKFHSPSDAPDKWDVFKAYNKRDVETELAIDHKISRFPVPDFLWEEYILDQEINDRGIRIDVDMVNNAINIDAQVKEKMTAEMKRLTGLDNPNSVQQMREWLSQNGIETEEEDLLPLVKSWREANPHIVKSWLDIDHCAKQAIKGKTTVKLGLLTFEYESGFLFITLPSGRKLAYVRPKIAANNFGSESITYEGVGTNKHWERLESYGAKIYENCIQGIARDILFHSLKILSHCFIVATVHDEIIIEADKRMSVEAVCEQMARTPAWADGLLLRADGYECDFYKKD